MDEHIGVWKVDGEVPHLRQHNAVQLAVSKPFVDSLSLRLRGFSHDKGSANLLRNSRNLVNILADDEDASFWILSEQFTKVNPLCWIFCRDAELMSSLSERVLHASLGAHGNSYFDTGGGCNPRLPLEVLPGNIETLGPNESEHVAFSTVFAYERGRETKPSSRLEVRRDSKDRCGQEVHLVVNDEPPGSCPKQLEVRKLPVAISPPGEDLIGRERHRAGVFLLTGVIGDVLLPERGFVEKLAPPLVHGGQAGREHESRLLHQVHRSHADDGFAGAAGKNE